MKPKIIFITAILLTACSSPATATQRMETPVVILATKTPVPTKTLESTPTQDPSIPDGYTKDASGNYTKTENGFTYTLNERGVGETEIYYGPMFDQEQEIQDKGKSDLWYTTVTIEESLMDATGFPVLNPRNNQELVSSSEMNPTQFFLDRIIPLMRNNGMFKDPKVADFKPLYDGSHSFHFDFTNGDTDNDGNLIKYSWGLWDGTSVKVHFTADYEALINSQEADGFVLVKSNNTFGPELYYMVRVRTDENNNLEVEIAPSVDKINKMTTKQFLEALMLGQTSVMTQAPELVTPSTSTILSLFVLSPEYYPLFDPDNLDSYFVK